ncbi:MAG: replication factor C small subunit [archaeon]|nr:replication factor C small subunit [archaeon]
MFSRKTDEENLPWVEKYRPQSLKEIKGHEWIIQALTKFVNDRKIPHMIFTGPAGTGKTSTAIALIKDLLGKSFSPTQVLELNASDNVRMKTVQNEIKNFSTSLSLLGGNEQFKLIILDEADNIPKSPQQALRRIIEKSPSNIKFILMCNYENRLIDPIKSRCALFRFTPLPKKTVISRLKEVEKVENLKLNTDFNEILYFISQGDLRKAINLLQMAAALNIKSDKDYYKLYLISGYIEPEKMEKIQEALIKGDFSASVQLIKEIKGFSPRNFLFQLTNWLKNLEILEKNKKLNAQIAEAIAEIDYRITVGTDEKIQIEAILAYISGVMNY